MDAQRADASSDANSSAGAQLEPSRFRNRIIGQGVARADWFLANEDNWREHPIGQTAALRGALSEVGWLAPVTVNKRTSELWPPEKRYVETLIDGHDRVEIALAESEGTPVPYQYVDLAPDEERYALVTLDPITNMATTNAAKLSELLARVKTQQQPVEHLLNQLRESIGEQSANSQQQAQENVTIPEQYLVIVELSDEGMQAELIERLQEEGYKVRALIS